MASRRTTASVGRSASHTASRTVRHGGSTIGFRTNILRIPDRKFTVIVLANRNEAKPAEIADRIAELLLK